MTGDSWFVVDTPDVEYIQRKDLDHEADRILATTPISHWESSQIGKRIVHPIDEFVTVGQLERALIGVMPVLEAFSRRLAAEFENEYPFLDDNFDPIDATTYQLHRLFVPTVYTGTELRRFVAESKPAELVFLVHDQIDFQARDLQFGLPLIWENSESPVAALLGRAEWTDVRLRDVSAPEPASKPTSPSAKDWTKERVKSLTNPNRIDGFRKSAASYLGLPDSELSMLVFERNSFTEGFLDHAVSDHGCDIDYWLHWENDPVSLRTGRQRNASLAQEPAVPNWDRDVAERLVRTAWGTTDGSDDIWGPVREVITERLSEYLYQWLPDALALFRRARRYATEQPGPCCGIGGPVLYPGSQLIRQGLNAGGTPVVTFQHGGNYGYIENPIFRFELANDVFCGFGEGASEGFDWLATKHDRRLITTQIGIDRLRAKYQTTQVPDVEHSNIDVSETEQPTIVYVSSGLNGPLRHGPNFWPSDFSYFDHQQQVLDHLKEYDEYDIIFKAPYKTRTPNPIEQIVRQEAYENIELTKEQAFTDVLPSADIVIMDRPTTILLESMLFGKYIVYIDLGWFSWIGDAKSEVKDALRYIEWDESLSTELSNAITEAIEGATQDHSDFVDRYVDTEFTPENLWQTLTDENLIE